MDGKHDYDNKPKGESAAEKHATKAMETDRRQDHGHEQAKPGAADHPAASLKPDTHDVTRDAVKRDGMGLAERDGLGLPVADRPGRHGGDRPADSLKGSSSSESADGGKKSAHEHDLSRASFGDSKHLVEEQQRKTSTGG